MKLFWDVDDVFIVDVMGVTVFKVGIERDESKFSLATMSFLFPFFL